MDKRLPIEVEGSQCLQLLISKVLVKLKHIAPMATYQPKYSATLVESLVYFWEVFFLFFFFYIYITLKKARGPFRLFCLSAKYK